MAQRRETFTPGGYDRPFDEDFDVDQTAREAYEATFADLENERERLESMQDSKLRKIATICNAALALRDRLRDGEVVWLNHRLHEIAANHGLPDECVLEDDQTFAGQTLDTTDISEPSNA